MDLPTAGEEGQENANFDHERKAREFKLYEDFARQHRQMIDELAKDLVEYRQLKAETQQQLQPLWPVVLSPEEAAREAELAELKASKQEARRKAAEEARLAAEAAAAADKKGGKAAPAKGKESKQGVRSPTAGQAPDLANQPDSLEQLNTARTQDFNSTDDDPRRLKEFHEFKKIMLEMETGTSNVGSILGAMVY